MDWFNEGIRRKAHRPRPLFRRTVTLDAGAKVVAAEPCRDGRNEFECWINGCKTEAGQIFKALP
jgi:hypothetical protein